HIFLTKHPYADLHVPSFPTRRSSDLRHDFDISSRKAERPNSCSLKSGRDARVLMSTVDMPVLRHSVRMAQIASRISAGVSRPLRDRKSTRLNSSHLGISYAVFCLKKK